MNDPGTAEPMNQAEQDVEKNIQDEDHHPIDDDDINDFFDPRYIYIFSLNLDQQYSNYQ